MNKNKICVYLKGNEKRCILALNLCLNCLNANSINLKMEKVGKGLYVGDGSGSQLRMKRRMETLIIPKLFH